MGYVHRRATQERRVGAGTEHRSPEADPGPALQRSAGNQAVAALLEHAQTKLEVGAVDDPLEHEADAVADQVVAAIRSGVPAGATATPVARSIRRRANNGATGGGAVSPDTERAIGSSSGGAPLPSTTRERLESAFGADFGDVRVHTGAQAAGLNDHLGAQAFTVGSDIFFRGDVPSATDPLLAHELTHVVQQRGGADVAQRKPATKTGKPETETKTETVDGTTTTTTETKRTVGRASSSESESDVFDGTTQRTSKSESDTLAGAETVVKVISTASEEEITQAVELMARAGVFGDASREAVIKRGAAQVSAQGAVSGRAGAQTELKGSVTVRPDLFNALSMVMEAAAQVGVEGSIEGRLEAALGPLAASVSGKLHAFAGAMASCKGSLEVGITKLYAEAEAKVFAGAQVDAEGEVAVKLGDAEAKAAGEAMAMAGATAEAEGKLKIDLSGVEMSGKVEAFAGVKAEAKATGSVAYKGRTIIAASGKVTASAGIGGTAEGSFVCRKGKVKISGELAATLGIGTGVSAEVEIDLYALAYMVQDLISSAFAQRKREIDRNDIPVDRIPIIEEHLQAKKRQEGYDAYLKDFLAYNAKKEKQGKSGIKRERIEEIITNRWYANKENWAFQEFDEGVMLAAQSAFGTKLIDFIVQAGQVRAFRVERTPEQEEHVQKQLKKKKWF